MFPLADVREWAKVIDACFSEPRLARVYDALEGERRDIARYGAIASEVSASSVLDIGCGAGVFACLLASHGIRVTGVDPAKASRAVARGKPFADRVRWLCGEADAFDGSPVDLVTMTGNVAQVFVSDDRWAANLRACRAALRAGCWLVFETRDPEREAWRDWTPNHTYKRVNIPDVCQVEAWCELRDVRPPVISFQRTYVFDAHRAVLRSTSTLRFRSRDEVTKSLQANGFRACEVRDAPDRPGGELVVLARAT